MNTAKKVEVGHRLASGPETDRAYLDGEPIHCGQGLELLLADGSWLRGRYESARYRDGGIRHLFYWSIAMHGDSEPGCHSVGTDIPDHAQLRFPRQ